MSKQEHVDLSTLTDAEFEAESKRRQEKRVAEKREKQQAYEQLKNDVLNNLCKEAVLRNDSLKLFKTKSFDDLGALYEMLKEYSSRHADGKGSFTIENDEFRILYKKQGKPSFDERSDQAEKHIKDFLESRYNGDKDTKDLIMSLLERRNGELDVALIQKLYQMEDRFDNENWKCGIELLKESYNYKHSKDYVRFEKKTEQGAWENINLQFSSI